MSNPETDPFAEYTPAFRARCYLTGLTSSFADGTRPDLDANRCDGDTFPAEFARLASQWARCLDAAATINSRYYKDWNRAGGVLTVIAPATRDAALAELRGVWNTLCRNYISETLDRDRLPFDCPFCGTHVSRDERTEDGRCPACMCVINMDDRGTDWL